MKPEMITLKIGDATIKLPAATVAQLALASVINQVVPPHIVAANAPVADIPRVGSYWAGQGGINGGLRPSIDGVAEHYLIIADKDVGDHEWGGRGKESGATSKWNGKANTLCLLNEGDHPAAKAASEYTADGHNDFYLPSAAENNHCWAHASEVFAKDTYYWSSSQRSAYNAFVQYFADGLQYHYGKSYELRVRPVRRLFI